MLNKVLVADSPRSSACMTPVPVRTVRSVCALPYPPMSTPVLLKVSYSMDGGTAHVVS